MHLRYERRRVAILISFDTDKGSFSSRYERTQFYAKLHGRKQIIIKDGKRYEYRRDGLLDEIPHLKVDNSVFIVMRKHFKTVENFFKQWERKVSIKTFPVILDSKHFKKLNMK